MDHKFYFEDGHKKVDEKLTKKELLMVIDYLITERGTFDDLRRMAAEPSKPGKAA